MKNFKIQLAIMSVFGALSISTEAAFVSLPSSGASSAYTACNTTGNFGSGSSTKPPTDGCVVTQSGVNPPDPTGAGSGFTLMTGGAKTRSIIVNNTYTGGASVTIGSVQDWVWKNAAGTSCIYGTKVTMTLGTAADYQPATGAQYLEVNDIARGGFSGKTVTAAYSYPGSPSEVVFRIGRAYTAVQHRSSGYTSLPSTGLGSQPSINGLDSWPGTASSAQQLADYNDNWVDFTTDANARDDDGSTTAASSWVYVKADGCPALSGSSPVDTADAIRIRQTFQEQSTDGSNPAVDQRFIEISLPGFAPSGSTITPAHTNPY
jgi:hypothetical protein